MDDLTSFPNKLDSKKCQCQAIIETPKNRRNKFDYDPKTNLFKLGGKACRSQAGANDS